MRHDWLIGSSPETCWSFTKHKMIAKNNCSSPYLDSFCTIGISATILIPIYWGRIFLILLTDIVYGIVGSYVITYARNVTSPPHEPPRVQCVSTFSQLIPTVGTTTMIFSHLSRWIQVLKQISDLGTRAHLLRSSWADLLHQRKPKKWFFSVYYLLLIWWYYVKDMHAYNIAY